MIIQDLFSSQKAIGRRAFIINVLIINLITTIIFNIIPYICGFCLVAYFLIVDTANITFTSRHLLSEESLKLISDITFLLLLYPSIKSRIKDLFGDSNNKSWVYSLAIVTYLITFVYISIFKSDVNIIVTIIYILILYILFVKKGQNIEKNNLIRFNWGAFFGTWIWGLLNKVYTPMLMLFLFFTPANLTFALICGLKGNEWAYKKYNNISIEQFNQIQKKDTLKSIVLAIIVLITSSIIFFQGINLINKKNPQFFTSKYEYFINKFSKSVFSNVIIEKNEYRYYMNPNEFVKCDDEDLRSIFELAVRDFYIRTNQKNTKVAMSDLNKVTLYSSLNGEFLADCQIPEPEAKNFERYKDRLIKHNLRKNWKPELYKTTKN